MHALMTRSTLLAAAAFVGTASAAAADSWNERTMLDFSAPVMVPGATLEPGRYDFRLLDSGSNRHLVQIRRHDGGEVVATAQAVPIKRETVSGEVVLRFDPAESGSPPAVRAWFYPGSRYGHEFSYPEEQARQIASRTKTIVLSLDEPGTDLEKGTLHTYGPTGERVQWHGDAATLREWEAWRSRRAASARGSDDRPRDATAAAVHASFKGMRVSVDQLEETPTRYFGKQVSVDAEVEDVLGPRLFTIDEPNWGDLEGEILVVMPGTQAALVREDDRITVSGVVKAFARSDVEKEWGWQTTDDAAAGRIAKRPVLVASRIVGGDSARAMVIQSVPRSAGGEADGTKAADTDRPVIRDLATIATGDERLVGRPVRLGPVAVKQQAGSDGYFVEHDGTSVFVLQAGSTAAPAGDGGAALHGVVLELPDDMAERLDAPEDVNESIYVLSMKADEAATSAGS